MICKRKNRCRSISGHRYPNAPPQRGGERGSGASASERADSLYLQHMNNLPFWGRERGGGRGGTGGRMGRGTVRGGVHKEWNGM